MARAGDIRPMTATECATLPLGVAETVKRMDLLLLQALGVDILVDLIHEEVSRKLAGPYTTREVTAREMIDKFGTGVRKGKR